MQLNAITNLSTLILAGLAGAITPITALPDWLRSIAPAIPTYWAMRGFRSVILSDGGMSEVLLPIVVLLAFAAVFTLVTLLRFRVDDTKIAWA